MAHSAGISAADRRFRAELLARVGYGRLKPKNTTPLLATHDDRNQARAQYMETLTITIEERHTSAYSGDSDALKAGSTDTAPYFACDPEIKQVTSPSSELVVSFKHFRIFH